MECPTFGDGELGQHVVRHACDRSLAARQCASTGGRLGGTRNSDRVYSRSRRRHSPPLSQAWKRWIARGAAARNANARTPSLVLAWTCMATYTVGPAANISRNRATVAKRNGVCQFRITGPRGGDWYLDLTQSDARIGRGTTPNREPHHHNERCGPCGVLHRQAEPSIAMPSRCGGRGLHAQDPEDRVRVVRSRRV